MSNFSSLNRLPAFWIILCFSLLACRQAAEEQAPAESKIAFTPLDAYVAATDTAFRYELLDSIPGEGYQTYVIRMVSQRWLTEAEVKDPLWWHWLTLVVPEGSTAETALLFISGGSRNSKQPTAADEMLVQAALATGSVVASLHNVPNQPLEFVGDDFGPRVEDQLIAYGWRKFLEGGAKEEDAKWLARLPMTKAAVKAMDVITAVTENRLPQPVDQFVVAGGSKRGWTTWTTGAVDERVVAIAPIVIDMLNVVPSFEHHWRVYGFWAPAVGDYVREGVMEWQNTEEYQRLLAITEPFSYIDRLDMPKLLINATGDQFFLPDSWQFYWQELKGEKHLRYVPNADHSLRGSDAIETLIAFYNDILTQTPRPEFDWKVEGDELIIQVHPDAKLTAVKLWQAHNPDSRDFRVESLGPAWTEKSIPINNDGAYRLKIEAPESGFSAFLGELTFAGANGIPFKLTTGVVVTPDTYPHEPYVSAAPRGTPLGSQ